MELGLRPGLRIPVPDFATAADPADPEEEPVGRPTTSADEPVARLPAEPEAIAPLAPEQGPRLGHLTGLDGLRAIAVLAVLVYHSGLDWLPGGFLGVEIFFAISGYLITGLLISEWRASGRIDVWGFWIRRARRLLPALFLLLGGTLGYALVWLPGEVARLRTDMLAALGYVTNWYLIVGQQSYFADLGRQSPLLHLWSLAVEEQFYLLWPLALAAGLALAGRKLSFLLTIAAAVASAVWMALLYRPDADVSRVYFGTDTRLTGLLLGAALAFVWLPGPERSTSMPAWQPTWLPNRLAPWLSANRRWLPSSRGVLDAILLAGLSALGWFLLAVDESDAFLFRGGFAMLAVVSVVTIAAAVHPAGRLGRLALDAAPLRWLGTRSYSVYLWHWPVFMVTLPGLDLPLEPIPAFVLRLAMTAALAEGSYRFVETRFRYRRQPQAGETVVVERRRLQRTRIAWAASVAILATVLAGPIATASPAARPTFLPADSVDGLVGADGVADGSDAGGSVGSSSAGTSLAGMATERLPRAASGRASPGDRRVLLVGDSVVLAVYKAVAKKIGPVTVDAAIGRSVGEGVSVLRDRRATNSLGDVVIVDLGNNGRLTPDLFQAAMKAMASVPLVVWVNLTVPREWEGPNNRAIANGVQQYPNARMVDWHSASTGNPDLFWDDGYHPKGPGAKLFASLLAAELP
jgi:peptidoglycan/LPS O-acetylase OafA/YrhL